MTIVGRQACVMSEFSSVAYLKRVSRQPGFDLKREAGGIMIGLLAIIVLLIIQFKMGWIREGEGRSTVFINSAPYIFVFLCISSTTWYAPLMNWINS